MSDWQSIETAPKSGVFDDLDGERYERGPYLLLTNGVSITIGSFEAERGRWFVSEGGLFHPTHWMHLPALPETAVVK